MSKSLSKSIHVCCYQIRNILWNYRTFFLLLILTVYFFLNEEGIRAFCRNLEVKASPFIFTFLSNDWICQMMLSGGFLWLISPVASMQFDNMFLKFRSGQRAWDLGNMFAIFVSAILYVLLLWFISNIVLFPYLCFENSWGKVWKTLAFTSSASEYEVQIVMDRFIIQTYNPWKATILSFILQVLCINWLAQIMYFVNKKIKKMLGLYIAVGFLFLDVMLSNTFLEKYYPYSPVTLAQLGNYSRDMLQYGVTIERSVIYLVAGAIIFTVLTCYMHEKRE